MLSLALLLAAAPQPELARWQALAARVTITRDDWGIAHIRGRTDADAVFGAIYAQAEDDFNRIERNYLTALGRQAEADGEALIWDDLRHRLYLDEADLKAAWARSPAPMKALMTAWADGLNYYLATHRDVKPKVLTRFEPWMALSFTEGSIGGDVERVNLDQLRAFYGGKPPAIAAAPRLMTEPMGSNGIAIGPAKSANGHALLLINPHTSHYFRSELQMTSDEGLNAYGASTWGQFFIYQGFNPHIGWMHTSSTADNVDEFAETVVRSGQGLGYRSGKAVRPLDRRLVHIRFRKADGTLATRDITTFRTHHGPITHAANGKWIATALMNRPVEAIQQSWLRTKAADLASFQKVAATFQANSSNNTVFASDKGEIAFLYPQFMPRRNPKLDYRKPVDGSDPSADWQGLMPVAALPNVIAPRGGFIQNTNNAPWCAAGGESPKQGAFPPYIDAGRENARGEHALALLDGKQRFTRDTLLGAAFDPYLAVFARAVPALAASWDALPAGDPLKARLAGPITSLRGWDFKWGVASEPTTLAIFWATEMDRRGDEEAREERRIAEWLPVAPPATQLAALAAAVDRLEKDFGRWKIAWGEVNRFQRIANTIRPRFDDSQPSIPVGFVSGNWGSLASYGSQPYPNTKRWYGNYGNSFVAVVEFGPRVSARAVTAGGESGDPKSPHFNDQAERFASGDFRQVYFYPDQLEGHVERTYSPGRSSPHPAQLR